MNQWTWSFDPTMPPTTLYIQKFSTPNVFRMTRLVNRLTTMRNNILTYKSKVFFAMRLLLFADSVDIIIDY